jgi:cobalt-zinc-cadmium efflux system outer membrane protein
MDGLLIPLLLLVGACPADAPDSLGGGEVRLAVAPMRGSTFPVIPCAAPQPVSLGVPRAVESPAPPEPTPPDLPTLWKLALANNPTLREAAADVEAARGQWIQAGKYPNPRFAYRETVLGTSQDPAGDLSLEGTQEIVTAGKRRLDLAIAARGTDVAAMAYRGRQLEVLSRIRRAYHDYLGWAYTLRVSGEVVAALEESVRIVRRQVEEAKIRPRTDLVRLGAVLEEARLTQSRAGISLVTAWRQLAAEVGIPDLPLPPPPSVGEGPVPRWDADAVLRRVLAVHTELRRAGLQAARAQLEVERARAEAVPNVTVGGGYSANYPENQHGGTISVEAPLPLWDRRQGRVHEAQARLAKARAAEQTTASRLAQETAAAFGRYQTAGQQVDRLTTVILPQLAEGLALVRRGYQTGGVQTTFADVLLAEQTLNDASLRLAEARRELGRAVADLQGLMQLDIGEELCGP